MRQIRIAPLFSSRIVQITAVFLANGLIYGLPALYYNFIQLYIQQFHTPVNTGILLSTGPFVSIAAPLFWGARAGRAKYQNSVLFASVCGAGLFFFALSRGHSFWWLFFSLICFMFFLSAFGSLTDAITLEFSLRSKLQYGPIRLMGTLVYGALSMTLSLFTQGNLNLIFKVHLIMSALCGACVLLMPKIEGFGGRRKISFRPLFAYKKLMIMLGIICVNQFAWGYYINFFPVYITGRLGFPQWVWGVNVFLTVFGEIPFFLVFNRLFDKVGIKRLLFVSTSLTVLRYLCLFAATGMVPLFALGILTGLSPTVPVYCASMYISRQMPQELKTSGITLMYAAAVGVPRMLAGLAGGVLTDRLGVSGGMLVCFGLCAASLCAFLLTLFRDRSGELAPAA